MKLCNQCNTEYELIPIHWNKDKRCKAGWSSPCKHCRLRYRREHREERSLYNKEWHQNHKDYRKKQRNNNRNKVHSRFVQYKANARRRDLEFLLDEKEFSKITFNTCYYCGEFSIGKDHVGLDRLDSTRGYLINNIVPCCQDCNQLKMGRPLNEFLRKIKLIFQKLHNETKIA